MLLWKTLPITAVAESSLTCSAVWLFVMITTKSLLTWLGVLGAVMMAE